MELSFNTPMRHPRSPLPTPTRTPTDRFIAARESRDSTSPTTSSPPRKTSVKGELHGLLPVRLPPALPSSTSYRTDDEATTATTSRAGSPGELLSKLRLDGNGSSSPYGTPSRGGQGGMAQEVEPYTNKLAKALFTDAPHTSVLNIQPVNTSPHRPFQEECRFNSSLGVVYEANRSRNFRTRNFRVIAQTPERILDAADMIDDFYLNLVDWSSTDLLSVALQSAVYIWEAATSSITQLPTTRPADAPGSIVCGLNWAPDGQHLALGMGDGTTEVWDVEAQTMVRSWQEHRGRVGSLNWLGTGEVLATGGKDTTIRMHDMRQRATTQVLRGHQQEVCGLRWNPAGHLLASGGNDNQLLVWDRRLLDGNSTTTRPQLYLNQHTAAVKAIAWNPVQTSLLVSGGGTDDKSLRFWNTSTGECIHHIDAQSQVCGVLWNHAGTELVSSHGFSQNQLTIWKYPSLRRVADLTGHTSRVLHLCLSADGEVVVSAAGDETIRFWRVFQKETERESSPYSPLGSGCYSSPYSTRKRGPSASSCYYDPLQDEIALR